MGWAHSYCHGCSNGLVAATADEVVNDVQVCPHCNTSMTPNITRDELIVSMANDIAELKERPMTPDTDKQPRTWDEATERKAFEDAAYAHYLRTRGERRNKGIVGVLDNPAAPHPRVLLFHRTTGGDYAVIAYQQAWGGWKLARGGL